MGGYDSFSFGYKEGQVLRLETALKEICLELESRGLNDILSSCPKALTWWNQTGKPQHESNLAREERQKKKQEKENARLRDYYKSSWPR